MRSVLDLGSGTGNFSEGFRRRGWKVQRIDNDPQFAKVPNTSIEDIFQFNAKPGQYGVVVAGPTCGPFSFAAGPGTERWVHAQDGARFPFYGPRLPRTVDALIGCALVLRIREIIRRVRPRYFFIENPQGGLQTMGFMDDLPRVTVTYCQYGERRMKPTTVFGRFPKSWAPKKKCSNGSRCHIRAPRGTDAPGTTIGLKGPARAAIPIPLSLEIAKAVEKSW